MVGPKCRSWAKIGGRQAHLDSYLPLRLLVTRFRVWWLGLERQRGMQAKVIRSACGSNTSRLVR